MRKRFRIALVIETTAEHGRSIVRGVTSFAEQRAAWEVFWMPLGQNDALILREALNANGLITRVLDDPLVDIVRRATIPVVVVHHWGNLQVPNVGSDSSKVAKIAAEHLISQGFQHFGFFGVDRPFARARYQAYADFLKRKRLACHASFAGSVDSLTFRWYASNPETEQWLKSLPKPIGVLAANDTTGQQLLLCARHLGIRVPDELAIVGVDNDELLCRLTTPPLSSIDIGGEHIGYRAATMMDRLLKGKKVSRRSVLVSPVGLVIRHSSDVLAIRDKNVATAVRFIRQNIARNLSVDDVLEEVPVARRTLEQAFRKSLGRSIHDEITQSRIRLAKQLLLKTEMRILDIAESCGFRHRTHLSMVFRKETGLSPAGFRKKFHKPR